MTRAYARLIVVLALAAGISACGNKGPLVLPDKEKPAQEQKAKPAGKPDAAKPAEPHR